MGRTQAMDIVTMRSGGQGLDGDVDRGEKRRAPSVASCCSWARRVSRSTRRCFLLAPSRSNRVARRSKSSIWQLVRSASVSAAKTSRSQPARRRCKRTYAAVSSGRNGPTDKRVWIRDKKERLNLRPRGSLFPSPTPNS